DVEELRRRAQKRLDDAEKAIDGCQKRLDELVGLSATKPAEAVDNMAQNLSQLSMTDEDIGNTRALLLEKAESDLTKAEEKYERRLDELRQAIAVVANTRTLAEFEKAYDECTNALGNTQQPAPRGNIFDMLPVNIRLDTVLSTHKIKMPIRAYRYSYDETIEAEAIKFQERCMGDPNVAAKVFSAYHPDPDPRRQTGSRLEDCFTDHVIAQLGPRLAFLLEHVLGLTDVSLEKLAANNGVDTRLSAHRKWGQNPAFVLPIEVKSKYEETRGTSGQASSTGDRGRYYSAPLLLPATAAAERDAIPAQPCTDDDYFKLNKDDLTKAANGFTPVYIWYALTQTSYYMERELSSQNRAIVISRDGLMLLHRVSTVTTLISRLIPYTSTRPHPAAAIAYWAEQAAKRPDPTRPHYRGNCDTSA
ncbi:hypothetical protein GGI12_005961, partial [Dipsacomyces acuminosporus]